LFPAQIVEQGAAPMTAVAGAGGALALHCDSETAQELLRSVARLRVILESLRPQSPS
jgi:hypothetical protein